MSSIVVFVAYRALPEHVETARREITTLIATVQASEPECEGVRMLQDAGDPTRFVLIEHWPSQDVFLGPHMQQPHIQSFIRGADAFLAGPPDISFWHPVAEV